MNLTIFAGKGGVGKSTSAAAYAIKQSKQNKVLIVDYDGGHSLSRVFSLDTKPKSNKIIPVTTNMELAVIDPVKFEPIETFQQNKNTEMYLQQFERDQGLVPFCDMITTFFGAPTDIDSLSRFSSLMSAYHQAKEKKISDLIIDVEPTAGLERLLAATNAITRSIQNLKDLNLIKIALIGKAWPDIREYIKGKYIQESGENSKRMLETSNEIKNSDYTLVCTPESSPVDEMSDVRRTIESFGGTINRYVINNLRGEPHEEIQIERVKKMARKLPVIEIKHDSRLCDSNQEARLEALSEIGNLF